MPKPNDRLSAALVKSSLEFRKLQLWSELEGDAAFLIRLPEEADPLVAILVGQAGEELGLYVFRGAAALAGARRFVLDDYDEDHPPLPPQASMLNVSFGPLSTIATDRRRILDAAGFVGRRESIAPDYFVLLADNHSRLPNRTEIRLLVGALDAIRAARLEGPLETGSVVLDDELPTLHAGESASAVERSREPIPPPDDVRLAIDIDSNEVRESPKHSGRWLAGFVDVAPPTGSASSERMRGLAVFEEDTGELVVAAAVDPDQIVEIAESIVAEFFEPRRSGSEGRPSAIAFGHPAIARWLAPVFDDLEVAVSHAESPARFDELAKAAEDPIARALADSRADSPPTSGTPGSPEEWKDLARRLYERMVDSVFTACDGASEAAAEFFGDPEAAARELRDRAMEAGPAFVEWFAVEWLDDATDQSLVERWMARADSPAVRELLAARQRAAVSIYRIDATRPTEGRADVVDVLTGERCEIHDRALAESAPLDAIVPMRILVTPGGNFVSLAGPPMSPIELGAAVAFLEEASGPLTSDGLRDDPEQLGLLFAWQRERAAAPTSGPKLQNTDGHALAPQVATFTVGDREALISTLNASAEIEREESGADSSDTQSFVWLKETKKGKRVLGGPTVLGRIEVGPERLELHVNSDRRLKEARAWLEKIRGVRFVGTSILEPPSGIGSPATADEGGANPSPEAIETLREFMHHQHLAWLDTRIPMFDGRTPREVAKSPDGKLRVAMMIRTMPAVHGPGNERFEPPRDQMLREIGVEDATACD